MRFHICHIVLAWIIIFPLAFSIQCWTCDGKCGCRKPTINTCPPYTQCYTLKSLKTNDVVHKGCSNDCQRLNRYDRICELCDNELCNNEQGLASMSGYDPYSECQEVYSGNSGLGSGAQYGGGVGSGAGYNPGIGSGTGYNPNNGIGSGTGYNPGYNPGIGSGTGYNPGGGYNPYGDNNGGGGYNPYGDNNGGGSAGIGTGAGYNGPYNRGYQPGIGQGAGTNENPPIGTGALPNNMVSIPVAEYEQMKNEIQEHAKANENFEAKLQKINDDLKDCKAKEGLQKANWTRCSPHDNVECHSMLQTCQHKKVKTWKIFTSYEYSCRRCNGTSGEYAHRCGDTYFWCCANESCVTDKEQDYACQLID